MKRVVCGCMCLLLGICLTAGCGKSDKDGDTSAHETPKDVLNIQTVPEESGGGTMHYAQKVTVTFADCQPLVIETDVAADTLAPYIERQYELPGKQFLLIGHSSMGSGTETIHAMLAGVRDGRLELLDQLTVTTPRGMSAILLRRNGDETRIGIFEPKQREIDSGTWGLNRDGRGGECRTALPTFGPPADSIGKDMIFMSSLAAADADVDELAPRGVAWFTIHDGGFQKSSP